MTDEHQPDPAPVEAPTTAEAPVATEAAPAAEAKSDEAKLHQQVDITDLGACRKRIKVTVDRGDINARFGDHFKKLVKESSVAGFRPGKAPRVLVERRFQKEVAEKVKSEVLMASLQQLGEEHDVAPLSEPDFNFETVELPAEGPLVYEFEVEVRPQFDLPPYRGLKLNRPVRIFTEVDLAESRRAKLADAGQIVPKPEGNAQVGDVLVTDVTFRFQGQELNRVSEAHFRVERQLFLQDGYIPHFAEQVRGVGPGDKRTLTMVLASATANGQLAGQTVEMILDVKEVKRLLLPELTPEFVRAKFNLNDAEALNESILAELNHELENIQRNSAREQVIAEIAASANWELPRDLLRRQAKRALERREMEMRADGMSPTQIAQQRRRLEQDILNSTRMMLKEHFVLQKIAEENKLSVDPEDVNAEIERMADQNGESPRRLRARLEREGMIDALATEMVERLALNLILETAEYVDVPMKQEEEAPVAATAEVQAVPGALRDPSALPAEEAPAGTGSPESPPVG